jgi:hypothetical protein
MSPGSVVSSFVTHLRRRSDHIAATNLTASLR